MKFLVLIFSIVGPTYAFANPFANFVGNYALVGAPQVAMSPGMKYCDWQGFREMTGVSISFKNNIYVSDLSTKIDNGDVQEFTEFQEYSSAEDSLSNLGSAVTPR